MKKKVFSILLVVCFIFSCKAFAETKIAATHLFHMHMPNFWPYFDVASYEGIPNGQRIQYKLDGDIIIWQEQGKKLPFVPHDNLRAYYAHDAKQHGYTDRAPNKVRENNSRWNRSGAQITFSGALMTNIQNLAEQGIDFHTGWARDYKDVYYNVKTKNNFKALDLVHFTYHHSMGPLAGPEYFKKELLMHQHISKSGYFMGDGYESSRGFFPTELGFSERLIPVLKGLGIEWSFVSNAHLSRTLKDYPNMELTYTNDLISPPNKAYMINESPSGRWYNEDIQNQNREVVNKYPFAALPHRAKYVDPERGSEDVIIVIPVHQSASWKEGFMSVDAGIADNVAANASLANRKCFFVTAKDGDNSSGYGSGQDGYNNSTSIYSGAQIDPMTVNEYLLENPVPDDDLVAVEDGSWIDTGDSPGDQNWYHWQLPPGRWQHPEKRDNEPFTVDLETGYHFQMRFYALLQAYLNYAVTAEQIQVDMNGGTPLRIEQITAPVKGTASPAEIGWYFLTSSLDSGFAYYGENVDDTMKPVVGMENSLRFTRPFVDARLDKDKTGPSLWWVQRWPSNPGGLNRDKSTGWVKRRFNNRFALFTYAFDVNGIKDMRVRIRKDKDGVNPVKDNTNEVYNPKDPGLASRERITPDAVQDWTDYAMIKRKLPPNGMERDREYNVKYYDPVSASLTGDLYYAYIGDYENCLIDYYIEAEDTLGNRKRSEIQHVWIGDSSGTEPFIAGGQEVLGIVSASASPASGAPSGTDVTFKATVQFKTGKTDGHPHNEVLRIYFDKATGASHVAHWWFRNKSGGEPVKPDNAYKLPGFTHTDGTDGKSIDTVMKLDPEAGKYYIEIGPFTQSQKPNYVGHMVGAPLWTEEKETGIGFAPQEAPDVIAEIDLTPVGGAREPMSLEGREGGIFHYTLTRKITSPQGIYKLSIYAHSEDNTLTAKTPSAISYEISSGAIDYTVIVINEFLPAPSKGKSEWIELYNRGDREVDLSKCVTDDTIGSGANPYRIKAGTKIAAKGFLIIEKKALGLNNTGDTVHLIDPDGRVIDSHTYKGNPGYNKSIGRISDWGDVWRIFDAPTKGGTNGEGDAIEPPPVLSVNQTMMQGFYWEMVTNKDTGHPNNLMNYKDLFPEEGDLWNLYAERAASLADLGITLLWIPPPYKGMGGVYNVGYGPSDYYDLGEFNQTGSVRTKYGTKAELDKAISALHAAKIKALADGVLNHMMGAEREEPGYGWTGYDFSARGGKYDNTKLNHDNFNSSNGTLFPGKSWDNTPEDYLMGTDFDYQNPGSRDYMIKWGKWMIQDIGFDGFRLDAVKHCDNDFIKEWLTQIKDSSPNEVFYVGEAWIEDVNGLKGYLAAVDYRMTVFDFPLQAAVRGGLNSGAYDLSGLEFAGLVNSDKGAYAVTFADNHDTQRDGDAYGHKSLDRFKFQFYTYILMREKGTPCVWWKDYYAFGMGKYGLDKVIKARKLFAYGPGYETGVNDPDCYSYVRKGDTGHPGSGAVMLISDGSGGGVMTKRVNSRMPNTKFYDYTGNIAETVTTDSSGYGNFKVIASEAKGWSIWVPSKN